LFTCVIDLHKLFIGQASLTTTIKTQTQAFHKHKYS